MVLQNSEMYRSLIGVIAKGIWLAIPFLWQVSKVCGLLLG